MFANKKHRKWLMGYTTIMAWQGSHATISSIPDRINYATYKRTTYKDKESKRSLLTETKGVGGGEDVELQRNRGGEGKAPLVLAGRQHERSAEAVQSK